MFKPIIHNLYKDDPSYELIQKYNELISNKPMTGALEEKIIAQRIWKQECNSHYKMIELLQAARAALVNQCGFESCELLDDINAAIEKE